MRRLRTRFIVWKTFEIGIEMGELVERLESVVGRWYLEVEEECHDAGEEARC